MKNLCNLKSELLQYHKKIMQHSRYRISLIEVPYIVSLIIIIFSLIIIFIFFVFPPYPGFEHGK